VHAVNRHQLALLVAQQLKLTQLTINPTIYKATDTNNQRPENCVMESQKAIALGFRPKPLSDNIYWTRIKKQLHK
jgi:hypothetical protein